MLKNYDKKMKKCVGLWEKVGKENTFVAVNCRRNPTYKRL